MKILAVSKCRSCKMCILNIMLKRYERHKYIDLITCSKNVYDDTRGIFFRLEKQNKIKSEIFKDMIMKFTLA